METTIINKNNILIAHVKSKEKLIIDALSALDFAINVKYETGCERIVVDKELITDDFFVLSTKLAGEVLQKYINYGIKLAVYGDFECYSSKPLKDFIYESNKGNDFFFFENYEMAVEKLSMANE